MFRLLSAESYKLRRSKSFYICTAAIVMLIFLIYGMLGVADRISSGVMENGTAGVVVTQNGEEVGPGSGSVLEEFGVPDILQQTFSGDMMACITAIFISIFVVGEYAGGMIKNIAGKGSGREVIFFSKLIVTQAAVVLMYLVDVVAVLIGGRLVLGKNAFAGEGFWPDLAVYTGQQLLLGIALTAVFVLIGEVSRNYAAGISLGIGMAVFPVLLVTGLDLLCSNTGFSPSSYWLVTRSAGCPTGGFTAGYILETVLVALFWSAAAAGLGVWHFHRADIR